MVAFTQGRGKFFQACDYSTWWFGWIFSQHSTCGSFLKNVKFQPILCLLLACLCILYVINIWVYLQLNFNEPHFIFIQLLCTVPAYFHYKMLKTKGRCKKKKAKKYLKSTSITTAFQVVNKEHCSFLIKKNMLSTIQFRIKYMYTMHTCLCFFKNGLQHK